MQIQRFRTTLGDRWDWACHSSPSASQFSGFWQPLDLVETLKRNIPATTVTFARRSVLESISHTIERFVYEEVPPAAIKGVRPAGDLGDEYLIEWLDGMLPCGFHVLKSWLPLYKTYREKGQLGPRVRHLGWLNQGFSRRDRVCQNRKSLRSTYLYPAWHQNKNKYCNSCQGNVTNYVWISAFGLKNQFIAVGRRGTAKLGSQDMLASR